MDELQIITADLNANGQSILCAICCCLPNPNKSKMQYKCFCYAEIGETPLPLYEHIYTDDDYYAPVACNKSAKESFLALYKNYHGTELDAKLVECTPVNDSDVPLKIKAILRKENDTPMYQQQIAEVLKTELLHQKSQIY